MPKNASLPQRGRCNATLFRGAMGVFLLRLYEYRWEGTSWPTAEERPSRPQRNPRDETLHKSSQPVVVPGQLIVRFKPDAVQHAAALVMPRAASARAFAAAVPDEIAGPLTLLREQAGLRAVKPLFVPATKTPSQPEIMSFAGMHSALSRSATGAPRPKLAGFQLIEVQDKRISTALLKKLNSSKAVEFVEPVPNRWLSVADALINRQWGLRAIRWFNSKRPDAASVHVAVLDSGIDDGHPDLKDAIEDYRHDGNKTRDFLGHGSHVSGTIAAIVNNAIGIAKSRIVGCIAGRFSTTPRQAAQSRTSISNSTALRSRARSTPTSR